MVPARGGPAVPDPAGEHAVPDAPVPGAAVVGGELSGPWRWGSRVTKDKSRCRRTTITNGKRRYDIDGYQRRNRD